MTRLTSAFALVVAAGCAHRPGPPSTDPPFSAVVAMTHLEAVLPLPRAPGDPGREASIHALRAMMEDAGLEAVSSIGHLARDPWSQTEVPLRNLIGWVRPGASRVFVLATHFDTPPRAHADPDPARRHEPVPGANDGTSGVAVLLTLVPLLRDQLPPEVGFAVVLFDGEELGRPGQKGGYCLGSRHISRELRRGQQPELARAEFGIVLDMVGDRDLWLPQDPSSRRFHPRLLEQIYATAEAGGFTAFSRETGPAVLDDHVYLTRGNVPSVLLIDHDFPAWHTTADDRFAVSRESLFVVGEVVRRAVVAWFRGSR